MMSSDEIFREDHLMHKPMTGQKIDRLIETDLGRTRRLTARYERYQELSQLEKRLVSYVESRLTDVLKLAIKNARESLSKQTQDGMESAALASHVKKLGQEVTDLIQRVDELEHIEGCRRKLSS